MTTINKLTRTDAVSAGDVVPVYVQNQGDARGASMSALKEFMQANLTFPDVGVQQFTTQYAVPSATGFSVQIGDGPDNVHLILTPTSTFAAGTIVMPALINAADKQMIVVSCTQAIATLTISGNGAVSVTGAPTSISANSAFVLKFDLPTSTWYMVGNSVQSPLFAGGPLGTPLSGTMTNCTGLPISTGVSGMAAGVSVFLENPSSANLAAAVSDETGSGALVFATSPTLVTPSIGAASAESLRRQSPVTQTTSFTLGLADNWTICNGSASVTVTLPAAASVPGREIMIKTIAAFTVVSASANVVPLAGGAAGTAILAAIAGRWATLVSNGTNWVIMQGN